MSHHPKQMSHIIIQHPTTYRLKDGRTHDGELQNTAILNQEVDSKQPPGTFHTRAGLNKGSTRNGAQEDEKSRNDGEHSKDRNNTRNRDRSRSRRLTPPNRGTIAIIAEGGAMEGMSRSGRRRYMQQIMSVQSSGDHSEDSIISFSEADYEGVQPHLDDPMEISVVATNYKVERVLVDQGSSTNTTLQKPGKTEEELEACSRTLIDFAGKQVEIQGAINFQTTFGIGPNVKIVPLKFTILKPIVSTPHLCMKYLVSGQTTSRCYKTSLKIRSRKIEHPQLADDLKEIQISQKSTKTTRIRAGRTRGGGQLIDFLRKNRDAFAWALEEMPGVDPDFLYHRLSIIPGAYLIA
ncbi:hypothetical protein CR513_12218, partial [Mucuna pruriens]